MESRKFRRSVLASSMAIIIATSSIFSQVHADIFDELDAATPDDGSSTDYSTTQSGYASEEEEFQAWKRQQEEEFSEWKEKYFAELEKYKKDILNIWDEAEVSDKKVWVEYSEDLKTKKVIDYEKNEIRISIVEDEEKPAPTKAEIEKYVEEVVKTTPNKAREADPVLAAVEADTKIEDEVNTQSMLADVVDSTPAPTKREAEKKAVAKLANQAKVEKAVPAKKEGKAPVTTITIKMPSDSTVKRAKKFSKYVNTFSKKNQLDKSLVYAIMHTESAFNPLARSHIPAFGLMQIVPGSAGKDVTQKLEGKARLLSPKYLYDAKNNIQAGATYLNILYYSYLKGIKDPLSREYCAIAAYNTGAGNVSVAFTGSKRLKNALPIINSMTPDEVYKTLKKKLPYDETKKYLEKVVARQQLYAQATL